MDSDHEYRGLFITQSTFQTNLDSSHDSDHAIDDLLDLSGDFSLKELNAESTKFSDYSNCELMSDDELLKCTIEVEEQAKSAELCKDLTSTSQRFRKPVTDEEVHYKDQTR